MISSDPKGWSLEWSLHGLGDRLSSKALAHRSWYLQLGSARKAVNPLVLPFETLALLLERARLKPNWFAGPHAVDRVCTRDPVGVGPWLRMEPEPTLRPGGAA